MRRFSIYITLVVLAITCDTELPAQTPNPRYNFKHLDVQSGLAQNIVYHFLLDNRGYMWMGTRNGLTRYDGTRTINFIHQDNNESSIANNFITRILEDTAGYIWVGTDKGISLYNRDSRTFTNFSVLVENNIPKRAFCVPLGFVSAEEVWMIETETKSIKSFNTRTHATAIISSTPAVDGILWHDSVTGSNHIWTYLSSGTIHYIFRNNKLIKEETYFSGTSPAEPALQVVHVLPQNDSTVWLSTTAGLIELNPRTRRHTLYNTWNSKEVKELRYAAMGPNNLLWVATGNGIYTFSIQSKKFVDTFRNYRLDPFSVCSNNIVTLYFDRLDNIWCGSYGQGISYTNVKRNYFQKNLSRNDMEKWDGNNNVRWIDYDYDHNLWCMMHDEGGLWKLNAAKQIMEYREPLLEDGRKFNGRFDKIVFADKEYAWCISSEGLFQYNLLTNHLKKMSYPYFSTDLFGSGWIRDITRLNDQSFLFSTFSGLFRISNSAKGVEIRPFSSLNNRAFKTFAMVYQDKHDVIYVQAAGDSLHLLVPSGRSLDPDIRSISFSPEINQFFFDDQGNRLLFATTSGVYALPQGSSDVRKISLAPLPSLLNVSSVMATGSKLWVFGEKGVFCVDEKNGATRNFTIEDGLPANDFNPSALTSLNGEFMAGTTNGLVSFSPHRLQDNTFPPRVQLTNIYVNDMPTGFVSNPQETSRIYLRYHQNTFSFDFAPIAFHNAASCSFEYKLEGYDKNWIKSGNARYTRYSNIPPGEYTFHLRAVDANGLISPYTKKLELEIAKAFWQTTIFQLAVFGLIVLTGWLLLKWYLRIKIRKHRLEFEKQQAVEKERTRIATDMHDDLGAGLSRIKFLSETIGIKKQQDQPIEEDISKIRDYSHEMIDKMGEIVWALNEKNDSLSDLLSYTRGYAVEYLTQNGIACTVEVSDHSQAQFVTGEFRRNIYLAIKEALHNVVKHAQANSVLIRLTIGAELRVELIDDGIGFDENNIRAYSNGLANMRKRIADMKGQFSISNDKGTSITFTVPLPR